MHRPALGILTAMIVGAGAGGQDTPRAGEIPEADRVAPVVLLEAEDGAGIALGTGTGILIAPGQVLAVLEGIDGAARVFASAPGLERGEVSEVLGFSDRFNLALLGVETAEGTQPVAPAASLPTAGDRLTALGLSDQYAPVRTDACIVSVREWPAEGILMRINLDGRPPAATLVMPLLDAQGDLAGFIRCPGGGNAWFAVPVTPERVPAPVEPMTIEALASRPLDPPDEARRAHLQAWRLMDLGAFDRAEPLLRLAVNLQPDYWRAHLDLGICLDLLGRERDAPGPIRRSIRIEPGFVDSHYSLGLVLLKLEEQQEAEASFRDAIELDPGYAKPWGMLAVTLHRQGRGAGAIEAAEHAIALAPDDPAAYANLATLHRLQGRQDLELDIYERFAEHQPADPWGWLSGGLVLLELDRATEALAWLERAAKLDPENPFVLLRLAACYGRLGRLADALMRVEQALAIDPEDQEALRFKRLLEADLRAAHPPSGPTGSGGR